MSQAHADSAQFEGDFKQVVAKATRFRSAMMAAKRLLSDSDREAIEAKVKLLEFQLKAALCRPKQIE